MPKTEVIQTSFTGGEFGNSLFGRTDIAQYNNACALIVNWIIRPFGSILSTPGTQFINQCKTGGSTTIAGIRLIPFQFSVADSFIIEMGVGYFRFFNNGGIVVSPGTTPYEVAHTYAAADISTIQYCQNHDVLYLTHNNYPPATLTRLGNTNWVLANQPFTGGPFQPTNSNTASTISFSASSGTISITSSTALFTVSGSTNSGHKGSFFMIGSTVTNATTGLAVQGYVQITNVVSTTAVTASVIANLSLTGTTSIWALPSWSYPSAWPARCAFYQSRLFMARTDTEPQTVWGSKNFSFNDFAVDGGADDDALDLQLSATQGNDIKWLAPMNDLICGTFGGEFIITAGIGTGNPLTPATVSVIQQTSWGSEAIIPKKIGNFAYYVQRGAQKLSEVVFNFLQSTYKSTDRTILSPQINGGGFIDIAYQQNPDTVLWCLCSNGTLATMTREVDQEVQGWSRQVTAGTYASIAVIPSQLGPYDEVWVIATRSINGTTVNYVERFASQIVPTQGLSLTPWQDQCFYVHCGLTYDAFAATTTPTSTSISLSATAGTIVVTSSAAYFVSGNVGERIRAVDAFHNNLGELTITGFTSSTIVVGTSKKNFTASSYSAGRWGVSVTSVSGLSQLESASVIVLADGGTDYPSKIVSNGTISLAYNYYVVTVGLQAVQTLMTLPPEPAGDQHGTAQGKKQRINNVAFKLNNSYTGFSISGTTGTSFIVKYRDPQTQLGMPPPLFTGVLPNITFQDDYRYGSQVLIQNSDPFPMEILSIVSSIDTFDK